MLSVISVTAQEEFASRPTHHGDHHAIAIGTGLGAMVFSNVTARFGLRTEAGGIAVLGFFFAVFAEYLHITCERIIRC